MITKAPYGISGARSRFISDQPLKAEEPRTYDTPEHMQMCFKCPKDDCVDKCPYTSKGTLRKTDRVENDPIVKRVADMIMAGWRLEPLAQELGLTLNQVKYKRRQAIEIGLLD